MRQPSFGVFAITPPARHEKWRIWVLGVKFACLQADACTRDVFVRAPQCSVRTWRLRVAAYGLDDAPATFLMNKDRGNKEIGLPFRVSYRNPRLRRVIRVTGQSAGAITTNIDDIRGCGELRITGKVRAYLTKRFGVAGMQETAVTNVGIEISQPPDSPSPVTQKVPADA